MPDTRYCVVVWMHLVFLSPNGTCLPFVNIYSRGFSAREIIRCCGHLGLTWRKPVFINIEAASEAKHHEESTVRDWVYAEMWNFVYRCDLECFPTHCTSGSSASQRICRAHTSASIGLLLAAGRYRRWPKMAARGAGGGGKSWMVRGWDQVWDDASCVLGAVRFRQTLLACHYELI
jgi:hypothetical protein